MDKEKLKEVLNKLKEHRHIVFETKSRAKQSKEADLEGLINNLISIGSSNQQIGNADSSDASSEQTK